MKKSINYQELTNQILRSGGGVTNSANDYGNPIRGVEMQGIFYRHLMNDKKYVYPRIFIALIFFLFPSIIGIIMLFKITRDWYYPDVLIFVLISIFLSLYFLAGLKLLWQKYLARK